ncbi:alpha/beta fold hydrolase [Corynebacterium kalidii]|uniref:Alpha/beta fold hydrolase n=1 Tax=Corynebacterium kalidii TaxID=2931982 RepID=A0A9X1WMP8_9CORY|nr:alpha/beta fold hydrolase [Corynebacterium kalidii]MCJ7857851.1 alpha/beta fold hydrolase [Corynebacterium kalidii]
MGQPIVLLHGVGLDASIWDSVIAALTDGGQVDADSVVALDLPGHGDRPPLDSPVGLAELAGDVVGRLPGDPGEPVHLVGFSLGSLIAQYIAVHCPERVSSLTCVSSVCARTPEESAAVRQRLNTAAEDFPLSANRALERWFPDDAGLPDAPALRERTRRILLANDVDSYLHAYRVFAEGDRDLADDLHRIDVPVLAVTGELDPGSTPGMSHRIAERIPGTPVHVIGGARHMVPDTHPEDVAALIRENVGRAADLRR